jgi:hypothetical protein
VDRVRVNSPSAIPADVLEFMRRSVQSVWALELLLMMRDNADRAYTVEDLIKDLRASQSVIASTLPQFVADGLVVEVEPDRFIYRPSAALAGKVDRLAVCFGESPVAVVREIALGSYPKLQSFADAFRFRKE